MTRYSSDGREERYPELCRDVVHTKPDVIVTAGRDVLCFKAATDTVPVVASMADPVPFGIVASLARPRVEGVEADNACRGARQIVGQRLGQSDTRQAGGAAYRHHGGDGHDQERQQRLEIAAAEPQQRAKPAGSDQRHAKAELQPADDGAAPFDAGAGIDRARKVEPGEHLERLYARDRDRDGESQARSRRVSWP